MAPSLIARFGWPAAAAIAFVFLGAFALDGRRPDAGLAEFKPGGFLTRFTPDEAVEIEVAGAGIRRKLSRSDRWPSGTDEALRLLRDAAPLRVLSADEIAGQSPASYGFDEKATTVVVRSSSGQTFSIRFGGRNPLGVGNYAIVEGMAGVAIVPSHVDEAWQRVLK